MRGGWLLGCSAAAALALIIAVLCCSPIAVLIGLGLFSMVAVRVALSCILFADRDSALVICVRRHGAARRVVLGPAHVVLHPLTEVATIVDTSLCRDRICVEGCLLPGGRPTTLSFAADMTYRLAPHIVPLERLNAILTNLESDTGRIVRRKTENLLRSLIIDSGHALGSSRMRSRLEHRLEQLLNASLSDWGIVTERVELTVLPAIGIREAEVARERGEIRNELFASCLKTTFQVIVHHQEHVPHLAKLELARSLGRSSAIMTSLDLDSLLSDAVVQLDEGSSYLVR